jgi:hypothetical protein
MKAECISVRYEEGSFELYQKAPGRQGGQVKYRDGFRLENRGNGWGQKTKSSKLILCVAVKTDEGTELQKIWIDRFFKDEMGKLTGKRRDAIEVTMPEVIKVEGCSAGDKLYYQASETELRKWLNRAERVLKEQKSRKG